MMDQGRISEWYSGRSIFVTGATGFMGKVLIEKLLRSCPDLHNIYILIRSKNESKSNSRFQDFKRHMIFDRLRREGLVNRLEKLVPINGDVLQLNLDLAESDVQTLTQEVSVVFHCAASVRFNEPLKKAVLLNVRGTREVVSIAQRMRKLEAFVHVSTAYSHPTRPVIDEVVYPSDEHYSKVIDMVEKLNPEVLQSIENKILETLPNTYVYSKGLAEHVVNDVQGKIPACIFRPSIVCPSHYEPVCGWVEVRNSPTASLVQSAIGLLRSIHGNGEKKLDMVPVDYGVNAMIASAWHVASFKRNEVPVFNCTTSNDIDLTWGRFLGVGLHEFSKTPPTKMLWYPGTRMRKNFFVHMFFVLVTQLLPALILDAIRLLTLKKPCFLKIQRQIYIALQSTEYFVMNEWTFKNSNMLGVLKDMAPEDRKTFHFDASKLDFYEYMKISIRGCRQFILNDDDSSVPEAKRKYRRLFWMHQALKVAMCFLVMWILSPCF